VDYINRNLRIYIYNIQGVNMTKMMKTLDDDVQREMEAEPYREASEMAEAMQNLDSDEEDPITRMSSVDMNTRVSDLEMRNIVIIDELRQLGIFPEEALITRQIKRLSISKNGQGRKEKVEMVVGDRGHKENKNWVSSLFSKKD